MELDEMVGRHLRLRDLVECGESFARLASERPAHPNLPENPATLTGIRRLCEVVIDPVIDQFGPVRLTYGFAGGALTRQIRGRTAPSLDQHAGSERRRHGGAICPRGGQAVDFEVPGRSSFEVAAWIARETSFDRLYVYAADRPLHVSVGPQESRVIVLVERRGSGVVPKQLSLAKLDLLTARTQR